MAQHSLVRQFLRATLLGLTVPLVVSFHGGGGGGTPKKEVCEPAQTSTVPPGPCVAECVGTCTQTGGVYAVEPGHCEVTTLDIKCRLKTAMTSLVASQYSCTATANPNCTFPMQNCYWAYTGTTGAVDVVDCENY